MCLLNRIVYYLPVCFGWTNLWSQLEVMFFFACVPYSALTFLKQGHLAVVQLIICASVHMLNCILHPFWQ